MCICVCMHALKRCQENVDSATHFVRSASSCTCMSWRTPGHGVTFLEHSSKPMQVRELIVPVLHVIGRSNGVQMRSEFIYFIVLGFVQSLASLSIGRIDCRAKSKSSEILNFSDTIDKFILTRCQPMMKQHRILLESTAVNCNLCKTLKIKYY